MAQPQIRQGQLITTFGPGAMTDLPERSVLIAGLDAWVGERRQIQEPRLARKVAELLGAQTIRLECPPEADRDGGGFVRSYVFPLWFVTQELVPYDPASGRPKGWRTRRLVQWGALEDKGRKFLMDDRSKSPVTPVRFVRACRRGHLGDIDWQAFVHGQNPPCGRELYFDERGTSGDLGETYIRCGCGQERPMSQAADPNSRALGDCDGARPWLGQGRVADERCNERNRLLVRAASNAWLPQPQRVISLPERGENIRQTIDKLWMFLEAAESADDIAYERRKPKVNEGLAGLTNEEVWEAVRERKSPVDSAEKPVKRAEIETLLGLGDQIGEDTLESTFFARVLPRAEWNQLWMAGIERVLLVERLREVAALVGFTRFESASADAETGELDAGVRRAEISRQPEWVPAVENRGEGIFLQFSREALLAWWQRPAVVNRYAELKRGFDAWKKEHNSSDRRLPMPEYLLLHSFSHLLITAVALECGYPASSIMERVYAVPQVGYGVLLYTASSDAEGTLGGLVQAGRRIAGFVRSALELGGLCSNDPVCGQHSPANVLEGRMLHGAACHGCVLIAETSCEQGTDFLDRALVVRTVAGSGAEFFPDVI
jgi:hypothetical protein